jgi:hypothetical protein
MRASLILILVILLTCIACSSLTIQSANFAWPIESVLPVDNNGSVTDRKHSVEFNALPLFYEEHQDSNAYSGKEIRLIRDRQGYYYMTADQFKNVYVFQADDGELILENRIPISETGLVKPAFNQRTTFIELIDANSMALSLTHQGIEEGGM